MVFLGLVMMPFYYGSRVPSVPEYLRCRYNPATHMFNAWTLRARVGAHRRRQPLRAGAGHPDPDRLADLGVGPAVLGLIALVLVPNIGKGGATFTSSGSADNPTYDGLLDSDEEIAKADGIRINLWIGLAMLVLGLLFLLWVRLRPLKIERHPRYEDGGPPMH